MRAELTPPGPPPPQSSGLVVLGVLVLTCSAITGSLLLSSSPSETFVYALFVDEVMSRPWAYERREIRVEGDLVPGTIEFREDESVPDACEHRFVLERGGYELPVRFARCVVPDTLRNDIELEVMAHGALDDHGVFHAQEVIPRCPRHYDFEAPSPHGPHSENATATGEASNRTSS